MEPSDFVATRTKLGFSQSGIAGALGVDQGTISRWESGKVRIPGAIALALATLKEDTETMPEPKPRILVADPVAAEGIERLKSVGEVDVNTGLSQDALIEIIPNYQALVVRSETKVTAAVFAAAKQLQVVGRAGVGVDNVDLNAATSSGVIVVNAPQGNTIAATEHAIALIMAVARHIPQADASTRQGEWRRKDFVGTELRGKVLGIIGFGNIGFEVARRMIAMEMRVLWHDPFIPAERGEAIGAESVELDQLLAESDFITVHTALTPQTENLIGAAQLKRCKTGVRIVNVARGGIINEQALADAVVAGKVGGAAFDVFTAEPMVADNPLRGNPKIILTPHLGASTAEAQERVALDVADQIIDIFEGRPARYAVNAPRLGAETLKVVGPYMEVAEAAGAVATQLSSGKLIRIEIDYFGEIAEQDVTPLKASVIRGLLRPISSETVNIVNANIVAQSKGWVIEERLRSSHEVFVNLVQVRITTTEAEVSVAGTVEHGQPHIVSINDLDVDLMPEKGVVLLACDNEDRPGMIGRVGTMLGGWDINIRSMQVGRRGRRERALMLISVDESPNEAQIVELEAIDGLYNVRLVRF